MRTFILGLSAAEVVHLVRAETAAAHGAPALDMVAEKEYVIEENLGHNAYGPLGRAKFDLVTSIATLSIEPQVESGYWILETAVERALGPLRTSEEDELARTELTLDEFETELRSADRKRVTVRLYVQTPGVREDFDRWLGEMRARHPWKVETAFGQAPATEAVADATNRAYRANEAVGVFADPEALEAAVDELEVSGFDRAAVSVLATDAKAKEHIDRFYRTIRDVEDSGGVSRGAFVSSESRAESEAAAVAIPLYVGGFAGAAAVASAGGALALAIAATITGAAAGAGLGALLARAIEHRHTAGVRTQLNKGGLVLWISVPHPAAEKRAIAILEKMGAKDIHVQEIRHEEKLSDLVPTQPDPFLESDLPLSNHSSISARITMRGNRQSSLASRGMAK